MDINRQGCGLVTQTAVQRQAFVRAETVLHIETGKRKSPIAIKRAIRRDADESNRRVHQKIADRVERKNAQAESRIDHVVLVTLNHRARLNQMTATIVRESVFETENILRQPQVRRSLWTKAAGNSADVDAAEKRPVRARKAEAASPCWPQRFARCAFD